MAEIDDQTQTEVKPKDPEGTPVDDEKNESSGDGEPTGEGGGDGFSVEEILDEYGLESADELKEFIGNLKDLEGKIGDQDLDDLIENTKTLKKYQQHWAQQEAEKLKESETPEQTIKRLEKEKKDLLKEQQSQAEQQKKSQAAKRVLRDFEDTVSGVVKGSKEMPKEYRPFMTEFLGVDNPMIDVDISDKAAVRRLAKEGVKKIQKFEQVIIKRYLDGKIKTPKVSSTETPASSSSIKDSNPKNLKEAKKIMMDSVSSFLRR